jgi:hypothetical protein
MIRRIPEGNKQRNKERMQRTERQEAKEKVFKAQRLLST